MELTEDEEKRLRAEYGLKETQVLNCMFASWYPNYSSHTFKSRIVPLRDEFVAYLQDEGTIYLPSSAYRERKREMVDYSVDEWAEDDPALQRRRAAAAKLKQIHEIGTQSEVLLASRISLCLDITFQCEAAEVLLGSSKDRDYPS